MADFSRLIEDLLQDAADSQIRKISDGRIFSVALASQFFKDGVITLSGLSSLFEKHLKKPISEGRLHALLETAELTRVCKLCTRGGSPAVVPSQALATLIASKAMHGELRVTNGTDIESYSNRHNNNNTNMNESERIARVFNDELTCVVCMDTLEDAVDSSCCKTLCCLKCAGRCPTCPMCRKQGIVWTDNEPIRRIVGKKPAKCPHRDCSLWSTAAEITVHKEKCEHRTVPCTNKGCNEKMKYLELKTHTTRCKFRFTTCDVCKSQLPQGIKHESRMCIWLCGQVLCDSTIKTHESTCTHQLVPCRNRQCREQVQKRLLDDHMLNNCQYRLIFCPNNTCDVRMFAGTMANHINICPESRVNCRYCNIPCYRKNLDRHEQITCRKRPRYQCEDCSEWYWEGDDHPDTCSERFVTCPNSTCNQTMKAYFLPGHEAVCPSRKVYCRHAACDKLIFAHQQHVHENEQCPHRFIRCHGCYKIKPAWQMKGHRCGYDSDSSDSY